jgi:hypothetical protein
VTIHELLIVMMWKKAVVSCEDAEESHDEASRQPDKIGKGTSRVRYVSGKLTARFYVFNIHSDVFSSSAAKLILLP